MEVEDNDTDYDRESGGMQSGGEEDNNSQYSYNDDGEDEEYQYEDEDRNQTFIKTYAGMQYDGNMNEQMKAPGKSTLYPVYKQLSEICLVDINPNFYSATLTMGVKDQILMATLSFPEVAPFFPNAPPRFELQSKFRYPNEKFNILFNCHPQLLTTQWNFCTDIVQIVRDLIHIAEGAVVDTFDDDMLSGTGVQRMIMKLLQQNLLDITSLFPESQKNKLPSFGIIREVVASTAGFKETRPRGIGYSSNDSTTKWDVSGYKTSKLDGLRELTNKVQSDIAAAEKRGTPLDPIMVDAVYFIFSHTISRTITMEEFFRHLEFYEMVVDSLLPLPPPSEHIAPIQSLVKLYQTIMGGRLCETLEPNEHAVLAKLKQLHDRLERSAAKGEPVQAKDSACSSSSGAAGGGVGGDAAAAGADAKGSRPNTASSSKKRQLTGTTTATEGGADAKGSGAAVDALLNVTEIPRVVELEDAFASHKYASDMSAVSRMSAKWYRRLNMELGSMPESLPDNVVVFSGMQCSQPNLLKILMFPESPDTPYCGGCFVFDAFIPSDYPANPPKVNIITTGSGTVRFNPNLYNCGKVCLSLLGTWSGEKWNPEVSSLSQVINSILFLIFVEQPYFNEPGYQSSQGTSGGDKQSAAYNQVIRSGTLQFGYLDHFKKPNKQLQRYILPLLCRTWRSKGWATALQWATTQSALTKTIEAIEAEVSKLVGPAPTPVLAVSGEKAVSGGTSSSASAK